MPRAARNPPLFSAPSLLPRPPVNSPSVLLCPFSTLRIAYQTFSLSPPRAPSCLPYTEINGDIARPSRFESGVSGKKGAFNPCELAGDPSCSSSLSSWPLLLASSCRSAPTRKLQPPYNHPILTAPTTMRLFPSFPSTLPSTLLAKPPSMLTISSMTSPTSPRPKSSKPSNPP